MTIHPPRQITIIGTGLLGGSIGLALRKSGYKGKIIGVGRRPATLLTAKRRGCIDSGTMDLAKGVQGSDLVIIATPVNSIIGYLQQLSHVISPRAVVTDVGSTKQSILQAASRSSILKKRFVGSHPMAGSEKQGPAAAEKNLFRNKPVILSYSRQADHDAIQMVQWLWKKLGMRLIKLPPKAHDVSVARISHLPHAVAATLMLLGQKGDALRLASTGFADTTRIAGGDAALWADIFLDNRRATIQLLAELTRDLKKLQSLLLKRNRTALEKLLKSASEARKALK